MLDNSQLPTTNNRPAASHHTYISMPGQGQAQGEGSGQGNAHANGRGRATRCCTHASSCAECRNEMARMKHTISRRGATISGMYFALRSSIEALHDARSDRFVDVPLGARMVSGAQLKNKIEALVQQASNLPAPPEPYNIPSNFGCNVCFEGYNNGLHMPLTMMCGHTLCLSCMNQLREMRCPSCREPIQAFTRLYV